MTGRLNAKTITQEYSLDFHPDNDPWIAVKTGYEIQIDDLALPNKGKEEHKTGAIYDIVPPSTSASKHVGEWNTEYF